MTTGQKVIRIFARSAISGTIGGVAIQLIFGTKTRAKVELPLIGAYSTPIALGATIGISQLVAEALDEFVLDPKTRRKWDNMLMGFLTPALAAGASIVISRILIGPMHMQGYLKIAGVAVGSVIVSDYLYDNFFGGLIE